MLYQIRESETSLLLLKKIMYNKRYFIGDIYLKLQDKVLITHHITQSKLYLFKTIIKI